MKNYKYPYISDKQLFKAVMFACKLIRETGFFNKSCQIAADYYNVDVEEVKKQVRIRQGIGQKIANKRNPRKYFFYVIAFHPDASKEDKYITWIKATNIINARSKIYDYDSKYFIYGPNTIDYTETFKSQKEAQNYIKKTGLQEI